MTARKPIMLRIPENQLATIDKFASDARLSRTEYMIRSALGEIIDPDTTRAHVKDLDKRLTRLEAVASE